MEKLDYNINSDALMFCFSSIIVDSYLCLIRFKRVDVVTRLKMLLSWGGETMEIASEKMVTFAMIGLCVVIGVMSLLAVVYYSQATGLQTNMNTQVADLQSTIEDLQTDKAELETRVANLQTEKSQYAAQVTSLTTEKTALQNQVTALNAQVVTLNNTVASLNDQVATLTTQKNNLIAQVNSLTSQVNNLTADKNSLTQQINSLTEDIHVLEHSIAFRERIIDALANTNGWLQETVSPMIE